MKGIEIGDVGRITPEGSFDFFFNIYLPADHPINNNDVPEEFDPLTLYDSRDVYDRPYLAGSHVSSSSVQRLDEKPFYIQMSCSARGCVGSPAWFTPPEAREPRAVRTYAATHAESWFKYINGPRGRGLNSLYLVTGCEKAASWGLASFHSLRDEFQLSFAPITAANQYRWIENTAQTKFHDLSPIHDAPWNQATFIQGLSISLGTRIWARLPQTVQIHETNNLEFPLGSAGGNSMSSALLSRVLAFFGGGAATDGNYARKHGNVVLSDLPPTSQILHPGELINNYIFEKSPHATVVMSHDDDWCNILGDVCFLSVEYVLICLTSNRVTRDPKFRPYQNCY
ncbi:hypothetical protein B0H16DRAFT_829541 [Mycena metata]|uniref:Uncharacterized protein n=1 Tax=Mycena metata TaxID=1033252 RepID=A0AAD7IVP4_9AGAR|nr:hypothetical protein B0H16DRAFT_829541 [Mycena metata]